MDRFLIAPMDTGLQTDVKPFMIPDNAFSELKNAYLYRGRIRKRFGSELSGNGAASAIEQPLYSRCAINIGKTNVGTGIITGTAPGKIWKIGQQFSVSDVIFTVTTLGANKDMLRSDGLTEQAIFSTTNGAFTIEITTYKNTDTYFYPSEPIMGLSQFEISPVNNQIAYAFDTQFAYYFNSGRWIFAGPGATPATSNFHGSDSEFFLTCNYQGASPGDTVMFATNFHIVNPNGAVDLLDDPMYYFNGTTWPAFTPTVLTTGERVESARIIIPFKRRLLLLDTIERNAGGTTYKRYVNRCRFSHDGSPISSYAWLEPNQLNFSGGGWVDAATQEGIISAEYIKDRLIVYFERSTWELAYTGNEIEPFVWNKLNTELGCESTFSTVAFDKAVLTVGSNGITACNGANVDRIDTAIPNYIFHFNNDNDGPARIGGIRDYKTEMVYWTAPIDNKSKNSYFPNTILTYNYKTGSWGENDDCITAFGYFEQSLDKTWAEMTIPWEECNFSWNSYTTLSKERLIIAGNQQGYITILNPGLTSNARNMTITDFSYDPVNALSTVTIVDHTLLPGDFVKLYSMTGVTFDSSDEMIHKVVTVVDKDTFTLSDCLVTGTPDYLGGGTCSRVSRLSIKSKQWNFYIDQGKNFIVNKLDFLFKRASGKLVTDFATNSTGYGVRAEAMLNGTATGTMMVDMGAWKPTLPLINSNIEEYQDRLWRSSYIQAEGNFIQLFLGIDDEEMKKSDSAFSAMELYAIMIHAKPTASVMEVMNDEF